MACVFKISNQIDDPMKWYQDQMRIEQEWEYDDILKDYHLGNVYISVHEDYIVFQDMSDQIFYGWETSSWIDLAGTKELIYAYYSDDDLEAEFIHIRAGKCIREFRVYDNEVETDFGEEPEFDDWVDVAAYMDRNML